jgi:predicted peroxiredoxin
MVWLSVAVNNWTGKDTRPKVKAPFHTARAMAATTSSGSLHGTAPAG